MLENVKVFAQQHLLHQQGYKNTLTLSSKTAKQTIAMWMQYKMTIIMLVTALLNVMVVKISSPLKHININVKIFE